MPAAGPRWWGSPGTEHVRSGLLSPKSTSPSTIGMAESPRDVRRYETCRRVAGSAKRSTPFAPQPPRALRTQNQSCRLSSFLIMTVIVCSRG